MYTRASLSFSMQNGGTPLMVASLKGHVDVVCVLIEAHADVHSQDNVWFIGQLVHRPHVYDDSVFL